MNNLLLLLLCVGVGALTSHLARQRGRNPAVWFVSGFLFGLLATLFLFLLPSRKPKIQVQPVPAHKKGLESVDPTHAEKLWFYLDEANQQYGPMSFSALGQALEEGKLNAKTYVWNELLPNWERFERVIK